MILLLDTNALHWWLNDPNRLSAIAVKAMESRSNSIVVSAAVPWELAIKTNLGKLKSQTLLANWEAKLTEEGFSELPIESSHAIRAGLLPRHHNDPFDRLLAAQAQVTGWPIITADAIFEAYGVQRIW
ncbi:MAG: type II toxin-antitoxin system VapC family toxin [Candidatus Korobacteraceae bacterium]|jgi:PIN domain nuclease of toxin-antitoxin system